MIDDSKIQDVYKIVASWCKTHNCYSEETVQDLTWRTWCKLKEHYDETKSSLSTYTITVCKNFYFMDCRKKKLNIVSLDAPLEHDGNLTLYDQITNEDDSPLTKLIDAENKEFVKQLYDESSDTLKAWLNGKTQSDIAKDLGVSQTMVSRIINAELKTIKRRLAKWTN